MPRTFKRGHLGWGQLGQEQGHQASQLHVRTEPRGLGYRADSGLGRSYRGLGSLRMWPWWPQSLLGNRHPEVPRSPRALRRVSASGPGG